MRTTSILAIVAIIAALGAATSLIHIDQVSGKGSPLLGHHLGVIGDVGDRGDVGVTHHPLVAY